MKTTTQLTIEDIKAGYDNPEYLGWGYLGEREMAAVTSDISIATIDAADRLALTLANEIGMTGEQFFTWLNSRPGRHYGDAALHGNTERQIRDWNMVMVITD